MPLYKYRCTECDNTFKILQKNGNQEEDPECPACGSLETKREISSVGIRFKGSGFYRTDYGNNGYKENGSSDGAEGNGQSSKTQGKSAKNGTTQGES